MCEALLELMSDEIEARAKEAMDRGMQQGMQQSMQQTIPALIKAYKKLNLSAAEILKTLTDELDITEKMAQEFVAKYV